MLELISDDDDRTVLLASATIVFSSCTLLHNGLERNRHHSVCVVLPATDLSKTCLLHPFVSCVCSSVH